MAKLDDRSSWKSFFFFFSPCDSCGRSSLWENEANRQTAGTFRVKVPFSTDPSTSTAAAAVDAALSRCFSAWCERVGSWWLRRSTTSFCLMPLWVPARPQRHFTAKCRKVERAAAFSNLWLTHSTSPLCVSGAGCTSAVPSAGAWYLIQVIRRRHRQQLCSFKNRSQKVRI